ncbi:hypothetical protein ANN_08361 [Periplaneta americana]|uniref:Uncharacterized protein n=1 Tax=Periplaneta americana TaxID=6978 RepID=A0ABQ8T2U0_PERAM|nr:hypothetical protein ANN_08361 [Periplaneta americana]
MAGLCESGNEPAGSLKAIFKKIGKTILIEFLKHGSLKPSCNINHMAKDFWVVRGRGGLRTPMFRSDLNSSSRTNKWDDDDDDDDDDEDDDEQI